MPLMFLVRVLVIVLLGLLVLPALLVLLAFLAVPALLVFHVFFFFERGRLSVLLRFPCSSFPSPSNLSYPKSQSMRANHHICMI